ncbi:MAG: hypothetical protein QF704_02995 [Anaerolineales bacterium]|nr:hypothetical protein [Anaerolineales bacterium]
MVIVKDSADEVVVTITESKTGLASRTGPMLLVSLFILVERPTGAYTPARAVEVDLDSAKAYALFALSSVKNEQ